MPKCILSGQKPKLTAADVGAAATAICVSWPNAMARA